MIVNGKYSQHILLYRGEAPADYRIALGMLLTGPLPPDIERDSGAERAGGRARVD